LISEPGNGMSDIDRSDSSLLGGFLPPFFILVVVTAIWVAAVVWRKTMPHEDEAVYPQKDAVKAVAFVPGKKEILVGYKHGTVLVFDLVSGKRIRSFTTLMETIPREMSLSVSANGKVLAVAGAYVTLWDFSNGQVTQVLRPEKHVECVSLSPDGHLLATGAYGRLTMWNTQSANQLWSKAITRPTVAFSPDGRLVAAEEQRHPGSLGLTLFDSLSGRPSFSIVGEHLEYHSPLAFSPDGRLLVWRNEGELRVYDLSSHSFMQDVNGPCYSYVNATAFSPDGRLLIAGCLGFGNVTGQMELWDVRHMKLKKNWVWRDSNAVHQGGDRAISDTFVDFAHDGSKVAVGYDRIVKIVTVIR